MAFADFLVTDDLTILLGLITASVFLLYNLYKPQSLVHPILLGRQSDIGRVRNPGESALHRNYGTGLMGMFPKRPARDVQTLLDLVKPEFDAPRTLWSTKISNPQLKERIATFGTGLLRAGLTRDSNVLLLLNDGIEFLITDFALASHSIPSFTLSSPSLLSSVLDSHPPTAIVIDAGSLASVLELIYDTNELSHHVVIVVGEPDSQTIRAAKHIKLVRWEDIEAEGRTGAPLTSPTPGSHPAPSSVNDVFTVSFFQDASGQPQAVQLTHENITAGVTAVRALLPLSNPLSGLDTIVSAHSLSTAFGRSVAYTAIYEGASFATCDSTRLFKADEALSGLSDFFSLKRYALPSPTIAFLRPTHLDSLVSSINSTAKGHFLFPLAWRQKHAGIIEGYSTKEGLWDRLVFEGARSKVMGEGAATLRAVVVSGEPLPAALLTPARIGLSIPLVVAHTHPLVAAPIFASHPHDLQTFAHADEDVAHVGPPVVNVETKLVGVDDAAIERGEDPVGVLHVRGPVVGRVLADGSEQGSKEEVWASTGHRARAQTNGSFKVWIAEK
ncbi:acetyl-CoA synthetase-like protein [Auriscalpium vulgare]|uniref:Acetyl-CoA synthetase-like protein n=1 Tax=Auriscalpium vulgare TaxID=40419 RepID=A0ACB8S0F9_9AGAM|nr:acetyl-CoA synthetase-like protein [Auriscalpium vulgare]